MKPGTSKFIFVVITCALLGVAVDFLMNGIVVGYLFGVPFKEQWSIVYCPVFLAAAATLSTFIPRTRFGLFSAQGVVAFLCGTVLGHLSFVGVHRTRVYAMDLDAQYDPGPKSVLLRSRQWPEILFVTSEEVRQKMIKPFIKTEIPVTVAVVTDYSCDRTVTVSTVAGVDIGYDPEAAWTWQVDHQMSPTGVLGPGSEDQYFFWCKRAPPIRFMEEMRFIRPWNNPLLDRGNSQRK